MRIKEKHPETKALINFDQATAEGKCCWLLWNRNLGGISYPISSAGTFQPGWRIAAVEMLEDCNFK